MTSDTKSALVQGGYALFERKFSGVVGDKAALCLSLCFIASAEKAGCPTFEIQAGTALFQCAKTGDKRHFGYTFEELHALDDVKRDDYPAMHVWVLDKTDMERPAVVDLATGYQFKAAQNAGIKWEPSLVLEKHFWGVPDGTRMIYQPHETATKIAYLLAVGLSR